VSLGRSQHHILDIRKRAAFQTMPFSVMFVEPVHTAQDAGLEDLRCAIALCAN
jgi:hypothetical protein